MLTPTAPVCLCRRHPAQSWFAMQQQQQQPQGGGVGDSVVQSLAELTEAMGSGMASLGLFSQVCVWGSNATLRLR